MIDKEEIISTVEPSKNIRCRTCKHKLQPVKVRGKEYQRYTFGMCAAFEYKPDDVLWENADCEFYEEE